MKSILVLLILLTLHTIRGQSQAAPADVTKLIYSTQNEGKFLELWQLFDGNLQKELPFAKFDASMHLLKQIQGNMLNYLYLAENPNQKGCQEYLSSFDKDLQVGPFTQCLNTVGQITVINIKLQSTQSIVQFAKQNPEKLSISVRKNGLDYVRFNNYKVNTICSVFKITVAIEYAKQVTTGKVNPDEMVTLDSTNRYYAPSIDSHSMWLQEINSTGKVVNGSVRMEEVAFGMIKQSSNCNTEFLQDLLGLENIDRTIAEFNLHHHDKGLQLVSSMLTLRNVDNLPYNVWIEQIKRTNQSELRVKAAQMHELLKNDWSGKIRTNDSWQLDPNVIDPHADLLISSTTQDQIKVIELINSQRYFDQRTQATIEKVLGIAVMSNEFNREHFKRMGQKGGSANIQGSQNAVMAAAIYLTDKQDNSFEAAYVSHHMNNIEFADRYYEINSLLLLLELDKVFLEEFSKRFREFTIIE